MEYKMLKRIAAIILLAALVFTLCSCGGKPEKTTDAMYQIGLNALSTADDYIEGKMSGSDAEQRIDEFYTQAKAQLEQDKKDAGKETLTGTEYFNDWMIECDVFNLWYWIGSASRGTSAMSDVRKYRDSLAKTLGK